MKRNIFNSVKLFKPKSNMFDLSHDVKMSMTMGKLYPVMHLDCVPGDRFNISCETLIRFQPMIAPVMHRMDAYVHYFFVPYRLLWENWEKFIVNADPLPAFPRVQLADFNAEPKSLADYLGIPTLPAVGTTPVNAFPFSAYQFIWNEYYRDQNLSTEAQYQLADGDTNTVNALSIFRRRAWEHDYFTASLPFAQKGNAVDLPLGTVDIPSAEVKRNNALDAGDATWTVTSGGSPVTQAVENVADPFQSADVFYAEGTPGVGVEPTTINDLRRAFRLQEWLEKNARGGTRYIENILAHFGIRSSDKRLQRPEYITGMKTPVVVSEVLSTMGTNEVDGLPQGNMSGHGISVGGGNYGSYFCEEHGLIMGIMSVMPKTAYQQGLPNYFSKISPFDFYQPEFANLGEQPVLNKEVYAVHSDLEGIFGYVPRYAEYKFVNNRVAGDMKTSLNFWHEGRIFSSDPSLNEAFIECNPDKRIFAVVDPDEDELICHILHKVSARRPMPIFGTPSI